MVCYQVNCIKWLTMINNNSASPCSTNPCRNGGICEFNNINNNRFSFNCSPYFIGTTFIK